MSQNLQGILWTLLATALFSFSAALAKTAVMEYHVLQILFFRQMVIFVSVLPTVARTFPENLKTRHPFTHGLRLLGAFVALSTGIWAVALLPLTTATTLAFSQVFFATLLAWKFLGEPIGFHRITAVFIGFLGVLIVIRPTPYGFANFSSFVPIAGAIGAAIALICVKKLSKTDTTATLLSYQAIFIGLLAGIPMFWLWKTPDWQGLWLLITIGVISTAAQWIGIRGIRMGEAIIVSTIKYTSLVYAAVFGYLMFQEIPDLPTLVGAAVIIVAAVYTIFRERQHKISAETGKGNQ